MVAKFQSLEDTSSEISEVESTDARPLGNQRNMATRHPKVAFPVTVVERPSSRRNQSGSTTQKWEPIPMKDMKSIKNAIMTFEVHSPYVKQLLSTWATNNKITPSDWNDLISAVLDHSSQIQWKALWRQESKALELQGLRDGFDASESKIMGEKQFSDPQVQAGYDECTFDLCKTAAVNALDKVREPGERVESYSKVIQGLRERFSEFLQ